jgi:drug/metabolite transporter (DMT)-like permease
MMATALTASGMTLPVFFTVLAAAMMHAGWNAVLKVKLEPILAMTLITTAAGLIALPFLLVSGWPKAEAWPWLGASFALHLGYNLALSAAYARGDMGQIYPIARGGAPLLTALASLVVLREPIAPLAAIGIAVLGGGVMLMSLAGRKASPDRRAIAYALLTAVIICGYTLSDGIGARAAGDPHAYAAALFVLDGVPLPFLLLWSRGRAAFRPMRRYLGLGFSGGAMSLAAYWIAIWAMTVAPIALVAALRETSVLFATLIAVIILKEQWIPARAAAAILIVAGIAAMRIG